jgi:hypothetical protein
VRTTFAGVKTSLPIASLAGWSECYRDLYDNSITDLPGAIQATCLKANLMLGCRATGGDTLIVAAQSPRSDVFFDIGTGNTTHTANGVGWYFHPNRSMGFVPAGDAVVLNQCDTTTATDSALRLCWHTLTTGSEGWRCGATTSLNSSTAYERIVYQAD